jgi:2-phospho-L-lactate guanylyltransferase
MSLWAIVPVKPFASAKSRLASVLTPPERVTLSEAFLIHTLTVLAQSKVFYRIVVISRDSAALALARNHGAQTITETGAPDLNTALLRATQFVRANQATAALIVPTDLPFLTPLEVQELTAESHRGALVTLAPDQREEGTNALFIAPPGVLSNYAFGRHSFIAHVALAQHTGAHVRVCRLPGTLLDIDVPEDLAFYRAAQTGGDAAP